MPPFAYLDLRVEAFVHATESPEAVERAVRFLAPGAKVERREVGGHFGQRLAALRALVRDPAEILAILERVRGAVGPEVARTAASRVDPDLHLHLRFDKQAAARGEVRLERAAENDIVKMQVRLRAVRLDLEGAISRVREAFGCDLGSAEEE